MKVSKQVFYCLLLCLVTTGFSQGKFKFDKEVHDFGVISEGTQAKIEFTFTNVGDAPIELNTVRASCGCTTPFYTKEPVMPGETGSIKVNYNSTGRLGNFTKNVSITSNVDSSPTVYIKGVVEVSGEVKEYTKAELSKSPMITVEKKEILMGEIEKNKVAKGSFTFTNNGKSDLIISKMAVACNCVQVQELERTIKPGNKAIFTFSYTPSNVGDIQEKITLYSNDLKNPKTELTLISEVKTTLTPNNMLKNGAPTGF